MYIYLYLGPMVVAARKTRLFTRSDRTRCAVMAAAMACPMVRPTKNAASQIARELTLSQGMPRLPLQAATLWKLCPRSLPEARRLCSLVRARQLFLPPWRGCRTPRLRVDAHANHLSDFWQN